MKRDLRYALRMLRSSPAFTAVVLLTVALGVGANTSMFAVVYAALVRALPYPDSSRIVVADDQSPGLFLDWRAQTSAFAAIAALRDTRFALTGLDRPAAIEGAIVTGDFFDVMGVPAVLGRTLTRGDDERGERVVVLADSLWRSRFGANPRIVGTTLALNGQPFMVVGVMPPGFDFPSPCLMWVPPRHVVPEYPLRPEADATQMRGSHYIGVYGRLKPGVTLQQAQSERRLIFTQLMRRYPDEVSQEDVGAALIPLREWLIGDLRSPLLILLATVGLVLLIACANIANLMLARSTARHQEISIRAALGAGRGQIIRQLLTESSVLAVAGGALGTLVAAWILPTLLRFAPASVRSVDANLGLPVLLFALVASIATGLLFGCAPALQASRWNLADALKAAGRSTGSREGRLVRQALVVGEFAISLALLAGAGLMVRSFLALRSVDPGFRPAGLQTGLVTLPPARYRTPAQQAQFFDRLLEELKATPGVTSVAAAARLPFAQGNSIRGIDLDPPGSVADAEAGIRVISPDYFDVLGIPIDRGRSFTDRDREGAPLVAIVNEAMARRYWPNASPIGRRFRITGGPWFEIVGVAADVKHSSLREPPRPEFFQPYRQAPWSFMTVVMRSSLAPDALRRGFEHALAGIDPGLPAPSIQAMPAMVASSVSLDRFETLGLALFAALALTLAIVGLYGVMSYLVTRRTRELGLRVALGARPEQILRLVIADGLRLSGLGMVLGLGCALAASRVLRGALYNVTPTDPMTFVAVTVVLLAVAVAASYIPARRATRVDPMMALRTE